MGTLFLYLLGVVATIVFTRFVFGIDQQLKAQKAQIGLLILMAKKLGASVEEVDQVLDKVYPKKR